MNEISNNIFLSWSGKVSNAIAHSFNKYLPYLIQAAKPFFSPEGINKDEGWFKRINSELISTKTGIVFLTKENLIKDWIFFESGGIFSKGSLCILLCDCDVQYLKEQNSIFQHLNVTRLTDKADLLKLFHSINRMISPDVNTKVIDKTLEKYYDEFSAEINDNLSKTATLQTDTTKFEGEWFLKYSTRDNTFTGGEKFRLTNDGKYILEVAAGNNMYYFQLNVLKSDPKSVVWQKLRVKDATTPTDEVHAVENLKVSDDFRTLIGEDTLGYKLEYSKIT